MSFPIHALCWTLLHSLWEGLLAAVAAGLVLLCTQRSSAALRYRLLTFVFFGLVAGVGATLVWELSATPTVTVSAQTAWDARASITVSAGGNLHNAASAAAAAPAQVPATPELASPWFVHALDKGAAFFDAHALFIVSAWLLILLTKLAQTGWSFVYVHRVRHRKVRPADGAWPDRLRDLALTLGLRRPITMLESGLIRVPMVVGYLKPVILVPMGILTQLPQDQLEAVLLHELAHIRRRDYLVNILQGLVEAVLFFNPAIWWISSLIREERENCCDDIAIRATHSKAQLIHALVAFQEYSLVAIPEYAVAFPGRRNYLLDRVKRIVYNRNKTLNAMEKFLLGGCLVIAACLTLAFTPFGRSFSATGRDTVPPVAPVPPTPPAAMAAPAAPPPAPGVPAITPPSATPGVPAITPPPPVPATGVIAPSPATPPVPAIDTLADGLTLVSTDELQGGSFQGHLETENNKISRIRGIWSDGDITRYYMDNKKIVQDQGVTKAFYIDGQQVSDASMDQHADEIRRMIATLKEEARHGAHMTINNAGSAPTQVYGDKITANGNGSYNTVTTSTISGSVSNSGVATITSSDVAHGSGSSTSVNSGSDVANGISGSGASRGGDASQADEAIAPVLEDILEQHLASNPKDLTFSLDNTRMLINSVRQPESVFESFRKKYVLTKTDSYYYARKDGNVTSSVHQHRGNSDVHQTNAITE
jgi:beta-lactamase regulating signal transducer with metallopeptidase domain